jgi:hypothetical protein
MSGVVRIPTTVIPAVGITIAGVITYAVTGGRVGAAGIALGVLWIMRAVRSKS